MYHPTTRLLTILELLQTHPHMTGEELARRLEVEPRTVRRYILMLQEMGMPVEGARGPGGGYRLRPGFKLPPLLFTEDEATAIVLGLLGADRLDLDLPGAALEGALAKVYRVLPLRGRQRLQSLSAHMTLSPPRPAIRPDAALIVTLSEAVQERQRVVIEYAAKGAAPTERTIEPYGVVGFEGHWYLVGHCCLRGAPRTFRLDRIRSAAPTKETFEPPQDGFDCLAFVVESLGTVKARWEVRIEFLTSPEAVRQQIPPAYGTLTPTERGALWETLYDDLPTIARYLVSLDLPFVIHAPPELRTTMETMAERMRNLARANLVE